MNTKFSFTNPYIPDFCNSFRNICLPNQGINALKLLMHTNPCHIPSAFIFLFECGNKVSFCILFYYNSIISKHNPGLAELLIRTELFRQENKVYKATARE